MQQALEAPPPDQPVTVNIVRTVRPGEEEKFEALVRNFIPRALTFPGHMGVHVVKPAARTSRDYHVVIRFATGEQWQRFHAWPEYVEFRATIEPLLEREPCVQAMTGLESWFTVSDVPGGLRPLPRWKMALVTLLAVYPVSLAMTLFIRPWVEHWPIWLQSLLFASGMVAILTWVVMPQLTRLLAPWLYPEADVDALNSKE